MTDDDRYDEAELREAESLAEALERPPEQRAAATSATDAIDAADTITASRLPELSRERSEAVWGQVNARVEAQRRRRWRRRAFGLAALTGTFAAAAAALLVFRVPGHTAEEPALIRMTRISEARIRTSHAQRAWFDDPSGTNRLALRARLAEYRALHLAELDGRMLR